MTSLDIPKLNTLKFRIIHALMLRAKRYGPAVTEVTNQLVLGGSPWAVGQNSAAA